MRRAWFQTLLPTTNEHVGEAEDVASGRIVVLPDERTLTISACWLPIGIPTSGAEGLRDIGVALFRGDESQHLQVLSRTGMP